MRIQDILKENDQPLQAPNAQNIDKAYQVGKVKFDCEHGLGAVPNNQDVKYLGFVMMIAPSIFLSLAGQGDREHTAQALAQEILKGTSLGPPFLDINVNPEFYEGAPLKVKITGHEGRGRMGAIIQVNGDIPVPVHMILRGGDRARHLSPEFFTQLKDVGIIPEKGYNPRNIYIGKIFWDGQTL